MWWKPQEFVARRERRGMDAGGEFLTTDLYVDGERILNAVELPLADRTFRDRHDRPHVQVLVCDGCGYPRCHSGDWVSPRWYRKHLMWLPAFDAMDEDDYEYHPPLYMERQRVPNFDSEAQIRLLDHAPAWEGVRSFPPVSQREAAAIIQWQAPQSVVNLQGEIRREDIIACSSDDCSTLLTELESLLESSRTDHKPFEPAPAIERITFFVDAPSYVEWTPMVRTKTGFQLAIDGQHAR